MKCNSNNKHFRFTKNSIIFFKLFNEKNILSIEEIPNRHNIVVMLQWLRRAGVITVTRANELSPNSKIISVQITNKGKERFLEYSERKAREQTKFRGDRKSQIQTKSIRGIDTEDQSNLR